MDVSLPDVKDPKHPVLASVLMGILRALDDESTGKSSSSSEDNAACRVHDRREPPCRRRKQGKSSEVETQKAQEYVIPPDEEMMSPKQDFLVPEPIRSPTESPKLHTILETEEGEGGEKQEDRGIGKESDVEEKKVQTRERDTIKYLQKEEVEARSSTSSPLVTSDDSDVAAFLSKHEYATLFGPKSGHLDKILIPTRFVQDYGETSSSVRFGDKSPLKRGSEEELERTQIKKQKSNGAHAIGPLKTSKETTEVSGHVASSSDQRKRLKTSEEENEYSSGETLSSDIMSDDTVEESTASSVLDDQQVKTLGRRKKKLTKTSKSLRIEPPDVDGMSDFSSDGQTGILKPSITRKMPGPKIGLGKYGWKSGTGKDEKSMQQKVVSTSLKDFSDVLSPDLNTAVSDTSELSVDPSAESLPINFSVDDMSEKHYKHQTSDSEISSSDFQSLTSSVSTEKNQKSSPQSERTNAITNETNSTVEDLGFDESSYLSMTTMSSELASALTSSEKLDAESSEPPSELQGSTVSSELTSELFEGDEISPPTVTNISYTSNDSTSSDTAELSENEEILSSNVPTLSSSLSTTSKSGTSSSKQSGIDPRDLPAILRTGTQQSLISPLNDLYSSLMSSDASNTSSNASTHMQQSGNTTFDTSSTRNTRETTTPTESHEELVEVGSKQFATVESSYHSSDYTTTGRSAYSSSVTKSITTSRTTSRTGEEESITDFVDDMPLPLSNLNLTDALLRNDPSPTDFEDSDTLTSSSDEYITHRYALDRGFPETSSKPIEEKLDMIIEESEVQELPEITDSQSGYLPVLPESEHEESSDDISTQIEDGEKSDDLAGFDHENQSMEETDTIEPPYSVISSSELLTSYDGKTSSDEQKDHLLMIDLDENEKVFDDILITNDTSVSSVDSEYQPMNIPNEEFALRDFARDIAHFVTLNAIATVITEIVVNVAITRLMIDLDFSLQMEKALFPNTEAEDSDKPIHMRWISPARYRLRRYSQLVEVKGYGGYELERSCKHDEGEAFLLCLERAFFPCLAEGDDSSMGRSSSQPESVYHTSFDVNRIPNIDKREKKIKSCKANHLITMALHVYTMAMVTISQTWSVVTCFSWTIWDYIRDNIKVSKMKRKDESTQYDESEVLESSTRFPHMPRLIRSDEVHLHILASRIVASALTGSVWGSAVKDAVLKELSNESESKSDEEYRLRLSASTVVEEVVGNALVIHDTIRESTSATLTEFSSQSENMSEDAISACSLRDIPLSSITFMKQQLVDMREIFQATVSGTKADLTSSTPPVAAIPTAKAESLISQYIPSTVSLGFKEDINTVAEPASSSGEEGQGETADESTSASPTEFSNQSENMSVSSEMDNKVGDDAISACSLSEIPLSSITFMKQQLADMREIFQATVSGTKADLTSSTPVAAIPTAKAESLISQDIPSTVYVGFKEEINSVAEPASSAGEKHQGEAADADEEIIAVNAHSDMDAEKCLTKSLKIDESLTTSSIDNDDKTSEHVVGHSGPFSNKEVQSYKQSIEYESNIVDSAQERRQGDTVLFYETKEIKHENDVSLPDVPDFEQHGEESVNLNDPRGSDSNSTSSSALSLSFSGISYIREQLANVKTLANSIMDDFNSYAEERTLVAKRSSQLTCSAASVRSHSRTIANNSLESSSSFNLHGISKSGESKKCSLDKDGNRLRQDTAELDNDFIVHQTDSKEEDRMGENENVFSQMDRSLDRPNENCNAKTHKGDQGAQCTARNRGESNKLKREDIQETGRVDERSESQAMLTGVKEHHSVDASKETVLKSDHKTGTKHVTETHQTRQIATFSRNSPCRRHVSRKKDADNPHGSYSGESTCSTEHSSSIVSRPSSSFSDGTVSSGSRRVTIESESQGKGRTDVSCRISDRGIWVNTAFVNAIDEDHHTSTSKTAFNENEGEKPVKNKIMINVKVSPRNRKKHHSHRMRSGVRDTELRLALDDNQNALAILDNSNLVKKSQQMRVKEMPMHVHKEVSHSTETKSLKIIAEDSCTADKQAHDKMMEANRQDNRSSLKHELCGGHRHLAVPLLNTLAPEKKSSFESQCSEESEKAVADNNWTADQKRTMGECLSDGAVAEKHGFLYRKQPSLKRKTRETKPTDSPCHSCAEKMNHSDEFFAAPVISRSERTRAVLSMLDDVADNLSLDPFAQDDAGSTHTISRMGSFRKLFHSRKNKQRNRDKTPHQSPRVLSNSSVTTESDGDSGSPECSSDSSHTPRSSSAASLLNNVLRNLSAKKSKKKSKGASSGTPRGREAKKGSVAAFDEMLDDLDDDSFIDDPFPSLVSVRDSPSEDNTSLNEVLQDLIEEWSFEGLQEALDSSPQSIGDRIRGKLNHFMAEVRKGKRRAELLFGRASTL